jgi:hypothetical protein
MGYEVATEDQIKIDDYFGCRKALIEQENSVLPFGNKDYASYSNQSYNIGFVIDQKIDEEIESQKFQSIIIDNETIKPKSNINIDQDTNLKGGFIDKLVKGDNKFKKSGIISPDEAAKKFSEIGTGMFTGSGASDIDDEELIESLTGKRSSNEKETISVSTSKTVLSSNDDVASYIRNQLAQLGADKENDDDVGNEEWKLSKKSLGWWNECS